MPESINQVWSKDFMHYYLSDGRCIRLFNVIDNLNYEELAIDVDLSLPLKRVIRSLDQIIYDVEFWVLLSVTTGRRTSVQNANVKRFNRTIRCEWQAQ